MLIADKLNNNNDKQLVISKREMEFVYRLPIKLEDWDVILKDFLRKEGVSIKWDCDYCDCGVQDPCDCRIQNERFIFFKQQYDMNGHPIDQN